MRGVAPAAVPPATCPAGARSRNPASRGCRPAIRRAAPGRGPGLRSNCTGFPRLRRACNRLVAEAVDADLRQPRQRAGGHRHRQPLPGCPRRARAIAGAGIRPGRARRPRPGSNCWIRCSTCSTSSPLASISGRRPAQIASARRAGSRPRRWRRPGPRRCRGRAGWKWPRCNCHNRWSRRVSRPCRSLAGRRNRPSPSEAPGPIRSCQGSPSRSPCSSARSSACSRSCTGHPGCRRHRALRGRPRGRPRRLRPSPAAGCWPPPRRSRPRVRRWTAATTDRLTQLRRQDQMLVPRDRRGFIRAQDISGCR